MFETAYSRFRFKADSGPRNPARPPRARLGVETLESRLAPHTGPHPGGDLPNDPDDQATEAIDMGQVSQFWTFAPRADAIELSAGNPPGAQLRWDEITFVNSHDVDLYRVTVRAGDRIRFRADAPEVVTAWTEPPSNRDPNPQPVQHRHSAALRLALYDQFRNPAPRLVAAESPVVTGPTTGTTTYQLTYTFPSGGVYYLGVSHTRNSQYDLDTGENDGPPPNYRNFGPYTLTAELTAVSFPDAATLTRRQINAEGDRATVSWDVTGTLDHVDFAAYLVDGREPNVPLTAAHLDTASGEASFPYGQDQMVDLVRRYGGSRFRFVIVGEHPVTHESVSDEFEAAVDRTALETAPSLAVGTFSIPALNISPLDFLPVGRRASDVYRDLIEALRDRQYPEGFLGGLDDLLQTFLPGADAIGPLPMAFNWKFTAAGENNAVYHIHYPPDFPLGPSAETIRLQDASVDLVPTLVPGAFSWPPRSLLTLTADFRLVLDTAAGGRVYEDDGSLDGSFLQADGVRAVRRRYTLPRWIDDGGGRLSLSNGSFAFSSANFAPAKPTTVADVGEGRLYGQLTTPVPVVGPPPARAPVGASGGHAIAAGPTVRSYDGRGNARAALAPFGTAAARVAEADLTGDGVAEIVAATGPGRATEVVVYDGATLAVLSRIAPFEPAFVGGVFVTAGDLTGDGVPDLVVTPDEGGGPRVRVFDGATGRPALDFFGIEDPSFRGGARAAVADVTGDGVPDLIVAAGFGGGPRVSAWDGASGRGGALTRHPFGDFFVFEQSLRNGAYVAGGDLDGDGVAEIIAGGGPGGGPRVYALSGRGLMAGQQVVRANFFAGDPAARDGVRLTIKDLDYDGRADLVTASGSRVARYLGSAVDPESAPIPESTVDLDTTGVAFVG